MSPSALLAASLIPARGPRRLRPLGARSREHGGDPRASALQTRLSDSLRVSGRPGSALETTVGDW